MAHHRARLGIWPAAGLALAAVLAAPEAAAYCRTSVCDGDVVGKTCNPPEQDDCGRALFWTGRCLGYSVQQAASAQVAWDLADQIAQQAFATWAAADCGGGEHPTMEGVDLGPVECTLREYNSSGGNANLIVFRDQEWPYAGQWNTLALTTVTYDLDTGEIYDADLEINGSDVVLTWDDLDVQYDLPSIVTHEVGHMLGLAHSGEPGSTMGAEYHVSDTSLRDLAADDVAGICTVYPPGPPRADLPCDPTPRHGFKSDCGPGPSDDDGCAVRRPSGDAGATPLLLLLPWLARRTRRARGRAVGTRHAAGG